MNINYQTLILKKNEILEELKILNTTILNV